MKNKEFNLVVNIYNISEEFVNIEGLTEHINNVITNPIDLSKYVMHWLHSSENLGSKTDENENAKYNNICKRLCKKYVTADNARLRYYFSEDNWNMYVEISR